MWNVRRMRRPQTTSAHHAACHALDARSRPIAGHVTRARARAQDGGRAAQAQMRPATQTVEAVKAIVAEARRKADAPAAAAYSEEAWMDGDIIDDDMH
jgi:hypothetical protein